MSVRSRYLATTLFFVALGLALGLSQWRSRPAPPRHSDVAMSLPSRPALPPTAAEVLDRADELGLSREQVGRLLALKDEWSAEAAPLETAMRAASAEFDGFAAGAKGRGGASLLEIQRQSADLRDLGVEMRARRTAHGRTVLALLTDSQRTQLRAGALHSAGGRR